MTTFGFSRLRRWLRPKRKGLPPFTMTPARRDAIAVALDQAFKDAKRR